jgi:hypothetical protein
MCLLYMDTKYTFCTRCDSHGSDCITAYVILVGRPVVAAKHADCILCAL